MGFSCGCRPIARATAGICAGVYLRYGSRMIRHGILISASVAALLLSGCAKTAAEGDFPSLAKRPQEDTPPPGSQPVTEDIPAPADRALLQIINGLENRLAIGEAKFQETLPKAQTAMAAARGSAPASEAWVQAAMLLAALEFDRGPSQVALAELDELLTTRATQKGGGAGLAEIEASWSRANALVSAQTREIEKLKSQLPPA
jgi:hypothetical protein